MKIAFDVDDTLIIPSIVTGARDVPNYDVIAIYRWFQAQGHEMFIWSGSGIDWAESWNEKLGLQGKVIPKQLSRICSRHQKGEKGCHIYDIIDIAFDDCDVDLGKVNIKVKRVDNFISRKEWNKNKHD